MTLNKDQRITWAKYQQHGQVYKAESHYHAAWGPNDFSNLEKVMISAVWCDGF